MKKTYFSLVAIAAMMGFHVCSAQNKAEIRALYEKQNPAPFSQSPVAEKAKTVKAKAQESVTVPFFESFENDLGDFSVINANNDASTWMWNNSVLANNQGAAAMSSTSAEADDWLFTPGLKLSSDRTYTITFSCWASGYYGYVFPEYMEVKYGQSATVDGMTSTLFEHSCVNWGYGDGQMKVTKIIQPATDGVYYIGFHGCSPTNSWCLFVDDIAVEQESMVTAPKAVSNLTAVAADKGALSATVSFTLPTEAINGDALTTLTKVELLRGDEVIKTWTNQQPGAELSFTDNEAKQGINRYIVKVYNAEGEDGLGKQATTQVYVGVDIPQRVHAQLSDDNSQMVATWTAVPETGANDHYVDPAKVRYVIYEVKTNDEGYSWAEAIDTTAVGATSYTFGYNPDEGAQSRAYYAIAAINEVGRSGIYGFDNILIKGKPYTPPFNETFANMHGNGSFYDVEYSSDYSATPEIISESHDTEANSGSFAWTPNADDVLNLCTGKMTVANSLNPKVKFAVRAKAGSSNRLILIGERQGGEEIQLEEVDFSSLTGDTVWVEREVSLEEFADARYFRLKFQFDGHKDAGRMALDDIHVWDDLNKNILVRVRADQNIMAGKQANIAVSVLNAGKQPIPNYSVKITANGKELLSQQVSETLNAGAYRNFTTIYSTDVFSEIGAVEVKAEATYSEDENPADNVAFSNINVIEPNVNPVSDLAFNQNTNSLSWNKPEEMIETLTEDFERYTSWTVDGKYDNGNEGAWGNWTTINNDEAVAAGLWANTQLPHQGEKYAYLLVNFQDRYEAGDDYPGRSGYQYLSSFVGLKSVGSGFAPLDNWLVSPELPGIEQNIRFFIMNESTEEDPFPVTFNVMTSTTGTDIDDFQQLGETYEHNIGGRYWIRYDVTLPEGTKYFAIQQKEEAGQSRWMGIDDITYTTYGSPVVSYNIYVDGQKVGSVNVPVTNFALQSVDGHHVYSVTAVYENGIESLPVMINTATGINDFRTSDALSSDIYTIEGVRVRHNATSTQGLKAGIYIVNGQKVVIK